MSVNVYLTEIVNVSSGINEIIAQFLWNILRRHEQEKYQRNQNRKRLRIELNIEVLTRTYEKNEKNLVLAANWAT